MTFTMTYTIVAEKMLVGIHFGTTCVTSHSLNAKEKGDCILNNLLSRMLPGSRRL